MSDARKNEEELDAPTASGPKIQFVAASCLSSTALEAKRQVISSTVEQHERSEVRRDAAPTGE